MASSGKKAVGHAKAMRLTSILLAVLAPWFAIAAIVSLGDSSYVSAVGFLTNPVNAVVTGLLAVIGLWHMSLGMEEVILDYIGKPGTKSFLLFLNGAACFLLGLAALYALYSLNFGV